MNKNYSRMGHYHSNLWLTRCDNNEHVMVGRKADQLMIRRSKGYEPPKQSDNLLRDFVAANTPNLLVDFVRNNGFLFSDTFLFWETPPLRPESAPNYLPLLQTPDPAFLLQEFSELNLIGKPIKESDAVKAIERYGKRLDVIFQNELMPVASVKDYLAARQVLLVVMAVKKIVDENRGHVPISNLLKLGFSVNDDELTFAQPITNLNLSNKSSWGDYRKFILDSERVREACFSLIIRDSCIKFTIPLCHTARNRCDTVTVDSLVDFIDRMINIHTSDIRFTFEKMTQTWRSDSLLGDIWYQLVEGFRAGRVVRCKKCGTPFISFERGTKAEFCPEGWCQKYYYRRVNKEVEAQAFHLIECGYSDKDIETILNEQFDKKNMDIFFVGDLRDRWKPKSRTPR